ncbi:PPC domain-containing protein [Roseomonas sp. USHLN139]|uniref:PPC domain-containing protein n=1 Tax=Roseomonas sp. USHLN139 TaxID=3081298 RepID=UPI003B019660
MARIGGLKAWQALPAAALLAGLLQAGPAGAQPRPTPPAPPAATESGPPKSGGGGVARPGNAACPGGQAAEIATSPEAAARVQPLAPDQRLCIRLSRGQAAYFRVAPEAGRDYTVTTSRLGRSTDTVLAGLDARGRKLIEDDDGGGDDLSSSLEVSADSRVAVIRAGTLDNQPGTFDITLTRNAPQTPPDFPTSQEMAASAPPLEPGNTRHLRLRRNQTAYFALPADRTGLVAVTRNLRGSTDTVLALLDAEGRVLLEDDDGGGGFASELALNDPPEGAVTLRVGTLERMAGEFDLVLVREAPQPPPDFPTTLQAARDRGPIAPGTMSLDLGRRQSAVFALPAEGSFVLETRNLRNDADTVLYLLDEDGTVLAEDDDGGNGLASRISTSRAGRRPAFVRAGTLNGQGGRFDLVLRASGSRVTGSRASGDGGAASGNAPGSIEEAARRPTLQVGEAVSVRLEGDQNAVFALPHDGRLAMALTFSLSEGADTVLEMLDAEGQVIAENDDADGGLASRLVIEPQPRPAYLRVKQLGGETASFQLVLIRPVE